MELVCQHDSMIKELEMTVSENEQLLYTLQEPCENRNKTIFYGKNCRCRAVLKTV